MTIEFINDGDQSEDMNKTISGKVQVIENANALKPCEMTNDVNGNGVADIGDEVTCDSESFYVYDNTGDNLKMLAKYNLYVGGYGVKYPNNTYAYFLYEEKTSNLQNVLMRADYGNYGGVRRGSIAFSRNSNAYSGSIVEEIVNNYSNYLSNNINVENQSKIINKQELLALGCVETNEQYDSCLEAPAFIYNTTYWVDWAHDKYRVNIVHYSGSTGYLGYTDSYTSGIRPVITISKDLV